MKQFEMFEEELFGAKQCAIYFKDRCDKLEKLCRDLHAACYSLLLSYDYEGRDYLYRIGIEERMAYLGLFEGEQHEEN